MSDLKNKQIIIENINTPKKLGVALKRLRKQKGLTQNELAEIVSIRQATVSDAENGKCNLDTFIKIIQALKVNMVLSNTAIKSYSNKNKIMELL